jgi:formamidopyrimidine-DNA glycosylase
MPELPEVETTRRGIEPHVVGATIARLDVRDRRLRWPVPADLPERVAGRRIAAVHRRAKYLLFDLCGLELIVHLGMSGSLRYLRHSEPRKKHDHVDWIFADGGILRFNDPRRFGCLLYATDARRHPLLRALGPEPLSADFTAAHLAAVCSGRTASIKQVIMNAHTVVGVGNIYANEALFRAGIHPLRAAGRISTTRLAVLVDAIRAVLGEAIQMGGTTLRDFVGGDGKPGYFKQSLNVYDRADEPCKRCGTPIRRRIEGQRATYYCSRCQR